MGDKTVIYSKQNGEPCVPVTVRIEWLRDGTIKPMMYWTPDGSLYLVKRLFETTPLALLKDCGAGLRFKVRAALTETADALSCNRFTRHDIYLYFVDNRYCGKNFIDSRYGHSAKEYIPVTLDVFPDGDYEIVYFWALGTRYKVEKTIDVEPRGSFSAGGVGVWHKVLARQVNADDDEDPDPKKSSSRLAALYFEINKWFVVKTA